MEWAKQVFTSFCNVLGEHRLKLHSGSFKTGILCKMHNDSSDKVLTARSQEDTLGKRHLCTCPVSVILFLHTSVRDGRMRTESLFNGNSFITLYVSFSGK